jgi:hypothetical protein
MANTWDQEMMRLHHRIDELENQNRKLTHMLSDAISICDAAIAEDDARRNAMQALQAEVPMTWSGTRSPGKRRTGSDDEDYRSPGHRIFRLVTGTQT